MTFPLLDKEKNLSLLLFIGCLMIAIMVILGGLTRLTGSGLSIVDWDLIQGIFPPLTQEKWEGVFSRYKSSPEYLTLHTGMLLDQFKNIFWLEYVHRLWGRIIGLFYLIPLILCWFNKDLQKRYFLKIVTLWSLILFQGVIGWYMVKSGLVKAPAVSHYRLCLHLMLAFITYGYSFWLALELIKKPIPSRLDFFYLKKLCFICLVVILMTVAYGALVAGLKAGLIYNTFPLMGDSFIAGELKNLKIQGKDFFENHALVQLIHRVLALLSFSLVLITYLYSQRLRVDSSLRNPLFGMFLAAFIQVSLGVLTLIFQVPLLLAILHQAGALVLFSLVLYVCYRLS
jgi:cytochrome c oxidase assembly protein subunit 15